MKKKLVTVIIPYFKKKFFFKESILSVINQTYKKLEIIVIYDDDNLEDLDFIKKICLRDKRIKLLINKKNIGAGLSRNKGINISKGSFIAFIDADDRWKSNKIDFQLKYMIKKNIYCSHTSYKIIDEKNNLKSLRIARDFFEEQSLLKSCDIGLSTVMINKSVLSKNLRFSDLQTKEDFLLWVKILEKKKYFFGIKNSLTYWRKTNNSLSSSTFQKLKDGFKIYNHYLKFNFIKSIYFLLILSINYMKKND